MSIYGSKFWGQKKVNFLTSQKLAPFSPANGQSLTYSTRKPSGFMKSCFSSLFPVVSHLWYLMVYYFWCLEVSCILFVVFCSLFLFLICALLRYLVSYLLCLVVSCGILLCLLCSVLWFHVVSYLCILLNLICGVLRFLIVSYLRWFFCGFHLFSYL